MGKKSKSGRKQEIKYREESKIKVSVLVPVCNTEKYLRKCLDSVVKQTLEDLEIICVNDSGADDSLAILKEFAAKDSRLKIIDKPNIGYGNSMNLALDAARGDYIGIVESDDFIAPDMYESLYALSRDATVDLVKGNFYDYYVEDGKVRTVANKEREMIPDSKEPFVVRQDARIAWGHPSVWSAIYRRKFLEASRIRFSEDAEESEKPQTDSADIQRFLHKENELDYLPFFYWTLCKAESVLWTNAPLYYRTHLVPAFSSVPLKRKEDLVAPLRRATDSLKALDVSGGASLRANVYRRALNYLERTNQEADTSQEKASLHEQARRVMREMDGDVTVADFSLQEQNACYAFASPLETLREKGPKILLYNWLPFDNQWGWGGGVTVYCRNLIEEILRRNPEVVIYFLSSGFAYMASATETFYRKIDNPFKHRLFQYEIVNSPVPADQRNLYVNPLVALENPNLQAVFAQFMESYGPFDVVHFQNIEGLSLDVLDLKKRFPDTKWIFSLHNYVPLCVNGSYYMRHKHCNCHPGRTGVDCFACTRADIRRNLARETYQRGKYGQDPKNCISELRWIRKFGFERLDTDVSPEQIQDFAKTATAKLNENCDHILAVSRRVYEIAAENGFDRAKLSVSYIGTKVAERQVGQAAAKPPVENDGFLKIVFLGSDIDYEEKGYPFLLDALEGMDGRYAAKIDLLLTVKQTEHAEMDVMLRNFHSVRIVHGYKHEDFSWIFKDAHLSLVPVLWEDNLPQIAIESAAYGVPVLSSDAGGAKELCDSPLFAFECGDAEDLRRKIAWFVDHPGDLAEYWPHHKGLVTMGEHWKELRAFYGLPEKADISISLEDFRFLLKEHDCLLRSLSGVPVGEAEKLRREANKAHAEVEQLQARVKELEGETAVIAEGKLIFQTEPEGTPGSTGAYLFKVVLDNFLFSDFYAEIHFVKISNLNSSFYDVLRISGSILEDDAGEQALRLHQADWERGGTPLSNAIRILVKKSEVLFFAAHPEIASGYLWQVTALTSRALHDSVKVETLHKGFFFEHELPPEDAVLAREPAQKIPPEEEESES